MVANHWPNDPVYGTGYHDPTEVGGGDERREKRSFAHQVPLRCNCPLVLLGELFIPTVHSFYADFGKHLDASVSEEGLYDYEHKKSKKISGQIFRKISRKIFIIVILIISSWWSAASNSILISKFTTWWKWSSECLVQWIIIFTSSMTNGHWPSSQPVLISIITILILACWSPNATVLHLDLY